MQRIVAQLVITATSILAKSFMAAYAQAKSGQISKAAVSSFARMDASQARGILNLESKTATRDDVIRQFNRYYAANDPDKGGCVRRLRRRPRREESHPRRALACGNTSTRLPARPRTPASADPFTFKVKSSTQKRRSSRRFGARRDRSAETRARVARAQ